MIVEIDTVAKTIKVKDATLTELTNFMTKNSASLYKIVYPTTTINPGDIAVVTNP